MNSKILFTLACSSVVGCAVQTVDPPADVDARIASVLEDARSATSPAAAGKEVRMIAIACHAFTYQTASLHDCSLNGVAHGAVYLPYGIEEPETSMRIGAEWKKVAKAAEAACGPSCHVFFGGVGDQCLAVARSAYYTGLGAFTGREVTRADAERTAVEACETHVGSPGAACSVVVSTCTGP